MEIARTVLDQLRDFKAWEKTGERTGDLTLLDYVGFVATPDLFFAFAELFWPQLIMHEGRAFLASGFKASTYDEWVRSGRSKEDIQRAMNHVHVLTLIQNSELDDDLAIAVARTIASIWNRTLSPAGLHAEVVGTNVDDIAVTLIST